MNKFNRAVRRFQGLDFDLAEDERGLSTVEYVIILVVIAVLAIGVWKTFGGKVRDQVTYSTGKITDLNNPSSGDDKDKGSQ